MENDKIIKPNKSVSFNISKTAAYLKFAALNGLKKYNLDDLTLDQYELLYILLENDGLYQRQLGRILLKDRPNVTRLVNILLDKNFVIKRPDLENKKVHRIYITQKGIDKISGLAPLKEVMADKLLSGISETEIENLLSTLEKIRANLSDDFTMQT